MIKTLLGTSGKGTDKDLLATIPNAARSSLIIFELIIRVGVVLVGPVAAKHNLHPCSCN